MKKIIKQAILVASLALLAGFAHANVQRCIGMKPDMTRLECFDAEVKNAPSSAARPVASRALSPAPGGSDQTCHIGPRGGRYRLVNGHKRYGC